MNKLKKIKKRIFRNQKISIHRFNKLYKPQADELERKPHLDHTIVKWLKIKTKRKNIKTSRKNYLQIRNHNIDKRLKRNNGTQNTVK